MNMETARSGHGRLVHKTDLGLTLIILGVCAALWYATAQFDEVPAVLRQGVLPTDFPRLVIAVIAVLALLLPFEHIAHARRGSDIDEERSVKVKPISMVTALVLIGLVAIMIPFGMYPTMVLASAVMPLLWGERRFGRLALYVLLFPLAVLLLFEQGLRVNLPPGVFGSLLG